MGRLAVLVRRAGAAWLLGLLAVRMAVEQLARCGVDRWQVAAVAIRSRSSSRRCTATSTTPPGPMTGPGAQGTEAVSRGRP